MVCVNAKKVGCQYIHACGGEVSGGFLLLFFVLFLIKGILLNLEILNGGATAGQ